MAADTLALSLYRLAAPTAVGRDLAARVAGVLAVLGIPAHLNTPATVLAGDGPTAPAPGPHVLAHGDVAVIAWPTRSAGGVLPMNHADVMLDALQDVLDEVGVYPSRTGTPTYQTDRPETCEVEALIIWDTRAAGAR